MMILSGGKMIQELKDAIDEADKIGANKKVKDILLRIASLKEENQLFALELIKIIVTKDINNQKEVK
jgi:hypothetical protein